MTVRRRGAVAFVTLLAALTAACEVRVDVAVSADVDGSGEVSLAVGLDDESVVAVGDLADLLDVADLVDAGWSVEGPRRTDDDLTWVRATKPFSDPAEASAVMNEISGADGPVRELALTPSSSLLRRSIRLDATVDLSGDVGGLSGDASLDPATAEALESLRRRLGSTIDSVFTVRFIARLPGSVTANAPTVVDGAAVWSPRLGQRATLTASTGQLNGARVVALGLGGLGLAGLATAVVVAARRAARPSG
ncbi:MAG TPA: hypothetical protein VGA13_12290 [Acidimicrobiales bacterium]